MSKGAILTKSKDFAVRIIKLTRYLQEDKHEYVLSKQILRSGTSIGANARESNNAQSRADFLSKLSIALKEADESVIVWNNLLVFIVIYLLFIFCCLNTCCKHCYNFR